MTHLPPAPSPEWPPRVGQVPQARGANGPAESATFEISLIVVATLIVTWSGSFVGLPSDNGSFVWLTMTFGVPMLSTAILIQTLVLRGFPRVKFTRSTWMWATAALPVGVCIAFAIGTVREPDHFLSESPWMLLSAPLVAVIAVGLGVLVWMIFVFPATVAIRGVRRFVRGEGSLWVPAISLGVPALGIMAILLAISVEADGSRGALQGAMIAAFFGFAAEYVVAWPLGLWLARGIGAVLVLLLLVFALTRRNTESERREL